MQTTKTTINCRGKLLDIVQPQVMGILNVTTDSFYAGSRFQEEKAIIERAIQILEEGGTIIDIGAQSTRPGAEEIGEKAETETLTQAIAIVRREFPEAIISADTYRGNTAKAAVDSGADIINDISGGTLDETMFPAIAELNVPYILMHIKGTPQNMQTNPTYDNLMQEVSLYFSQKVNQLRQLGVNDIILDPGFGFGKTVEHNLELVNKLDQLKIFGLPILMGLSRKSSISKLLNINTEDTLNATTVLNTVSLMNGASILRVHDVKEAVQACKLVAFSS